MDIEALARGLTEMLLPFIPVLWGGDEKGSLDSAQVPDSVGFVWSKLAPLLRKDPSARASVSDVVLAPKDGDAKAAFRLRLKRLLASSPELAKTLVELVDPGEAVPFPSDGAGDWRDVLGRDERLVERLEMIYLLRTGGNPAEVAKRFGLDASRLFRLNTSFSLAGAAGLLAEEGIWNWLDCLDAGEPILRRLDMIRLLRSGNPVNVVAEQYDALPEYVERINKRFSKDGVLGLVTEDEMDRFRSTHPQTIRVCSYNLHGTHDGDPLRLRRLARSLAEIDPHACAFQEVVSEGGTEDTGARVNRWISAMTGYHYRSHFAYCHQFMEKYPEGVGVSMRSPVRNKMTIDLTLLRDDLRPSLARNALAVETEILGRKVVFASIHLDHNADPEVRLAQAEKLAAELQPWEEGAYCTVLAGDFNDLESSPAMGYLKSAGYRDTYRVRHKDRGDTYPAGDPQSRIDYILVKGKVTVVSSGLLRDDPSLSDHIGLFAEIR